MQTNQVKHISLFAIVMVMLGSLLYGYEFFIRVAPSSLNQEMLNTYGMSDVQLSYVKAAFYFGYVCMQIPAGLLIDRFGPRRLLMVGMLVCSLSIFAFAWFESVHWLIVARIFAGMASSFAYLCPLVLIHHWLPHRAFGYAAGMVQLVGNLAAMMGTTPVTSMYHHWGMSGMFALTGLIGLVGTLLVSLVKPHGAISAKKTQLNDIPKHLKHIHHTPNTYVLALLGLISWVPMAIIAENYGVDYFASLWSLNTASAKNLVMTIWIGNCVGGPLLGWLSQTMQRRFTPIMLSFGISALCLLWCGQLSALYGIQNFILCLTLGLCSGIQVVTFATISDRHGPDTMGTASGVQNMAVASSGLLTMMMPVVIHWVHAPSASDVLFQNLSHLELNTIMWVLTSIMVFGIIIAALMGKETYCQQKDH